jgi:glucosamine--fructose-6-phosphate aminotransferase (isomerizing)
MCGIVGYIGPKIPSNLLLEVLKKLEYRGYDSCGVAFIEGERRPKIFLKKIKGKITQLKQQINPNHWFWLGIAHTRWATHGAPSTLNAHPHFDCHKSIFLVHNGIIENYSQLKDFLIKRGHRFISQTDTEVIPHLVEEFCKRVSLSDAFFKVINELQGSFAVALFKRDQDQLLIAKKESPLIVGILNNGFMVASDIPALCGQAKKIISLENGQVGFLSRNKIEWRSFKGRKVVPVIEKIKVASQEIDKKEFTHFMLKEIYEQPQVIEKLYSFYVKDGRIKLGDLTLDRDYLTFLKKVFIFACGTAYHAGFAAKYFLEKICKIDTEIDVSSEARYRALSIGKDDLVVVISQSGETADTLASVKEAKKRGAKILAVCNVLGSSLTKEADSLIYTLAGPEIGVASTKAYTAQIFCLYLFSLYLADLKKTVKKSQIQGILRELGKIPGYQEEILSKIAQIKRIAKRFSKFGCFLFLGRGKNYPSALEGALKLKEISYIPAEGYPAGEMKHGPIALIDEYRAVVCIAPCDELYEKMVSNIQEIKARKGKVLGILNYKDKQAHLLCDDVIYVPKVNYSDLNPLIVAIPLQLFAYFVAKNLGCEIDQPRNLAKSVTVE